MKAIRIHTLGGPEVLRYEDAPEPQVAEGQVLIRVAAAGVNYSDLGRRKGTYARTIPLPAILGSEVAGTVVQVGPGHAEMHRQPMHELLKLVEAGTLKPIVDRTFALNAAGSAHQYLAERRMMGKVLLIP